MAYDKKFEIEDLLLKKIGELADESEVQVCVVGGYVRDTVLGIPSKDIDLVVVGDPIKFSREMYRKLNGAGFVEFEKFRTVQMTIGDVKVEIVGSRKEKYDSDSRKPIVQEGTLEEDLSRRDFTINAMAIGLNKEGNIAGGESEKRGSGHRESHSGWLIDPFGGVEALEKKIIDTPLAPEETFSEDPLRILRAIRFACRLKFSLAARVHDAIVKMCDRIRIVSQERITEEFMKILSCAQPSLGLKLMQDTGMMKIIFPEISEMPGVEQRQDHHHKDVFLHTLSVVDNLAAVSDDVWLRFTGLVHDIAKPETKKFIEGVGWTFHGHDDIGARKMRRLFQRMKLPMEKLSYVEKLVRLHLRPMALAAGGVTDSAVRRLLFEAAEDFDDLMKLCRADITSKNKNLVAEYTSNYDAVYERAREVEEKDKIKSWRPPVNGDEIMEIFKMKPGKEVGVLKKAVEDAVLDGVITNDHDAAVNFLKSHFEEFHKEK